MSMVLQAVFFLLWAASAAYCAVSAYCLFAFFRREGRSSASEPAPGRGDTLPPVTVMKPLRGADADTYDNLASFVRQEYPRFQLVFGVADPADPAAAVVRRLVSENPGADISLVISGPCTGGNGKVSNLRGMYDKARYGILVISDSDMRVRPEYLAEVVSGFDDPAVGLVTCPYRGAFPEDTGAALEALTINTEFLPSVAVAERMEGLGFALGATMAVRRAALEDTGGFGALSGYLADDYMLGSLVRAAGWKLRLSGYLVDSVQRRAGLAGYFTHQIRWGRTYRVCRPMGYFLSVLTRGTALSVFFLAASGFSAAGWAVVLMNLVLRYAQALYTETVLVRGPGVLRRLWLLPVRDLLSFAVWFLSFTGDRVRWGEGVFRVGRDGRMRRLA